MKESVAKALFASMRRLPPIDRLVAAGLRAAPDTTVVKALRSRLKNEAGLFYGQNQAGFRRVPLHNGVEFQVHLSDHSGMFYFDKRAIEPQTQEFFREFLDPGDTFVDIGANKGLYSLLAASITGEKGHVYSFEANPLVFKELDANVKLNQLEMELRIFNFGLFDQDHEKLKFYLSKNPSNSGLSTFTPDPDLVASGKLSEDHVIDVPVQRFDTFAREQGIKHIDLIKIDTEGSEFSVLRGMEETLKRVKPRALVIETEENHKLVAWLQARGYCMKVLENISPAANVSNLLFLLN